MNKPIISNTVLKAKIKDMSEAEKLDLLHFLKGEPSAFSSKINIRVICCPFHEEQTPSCSLNFTTNVIHCFGCGVSGKMEFNHS